MDRREHDSITLDLESSDEEIRRLAVERLAGLGSDVALPRLVECLGDPSWRVRKAAVERLAQAPEEWPVAASLVAALSDGENPGRRNAAVEALVRCGRSATAHLLEATHSRDVDVRKLAVDTLAGMNDERCTERLLEMLNDPDPNVRGASADALGALGGDGVARALLETATRGGDDRLVAFSALQALARLEESVPSADLLPVLEDPVLRPAAFAVLGRSEGDDGAVEALLKGLLATSRASREAAMEGLVRQVARHEETGAEPLLERIRHAAESESFSDSLERLQTADLSTRLVLVQFFGLLGRDESVIPLLCAGRDEALAELTVTTLAALGEIAEAALDAHWLDLDAEYRKLACEILARSSGTRGDARLLATLDDPDADLRTAAAAALGRRRTPAALPDLLRRLESTAVRADETEAEDELGALTQALADLTRDGEGGNALRDQAVDLLSSRLEGAPEPVRLALAAVLGRIGRSTDTQLVGWLLKDPSPDVRREAVQALARLEHGEASEPLRLALADESPTVRIAAARALGAAEDPKALGDLQRLADDDDARVRAAAMRAVGAQAARAELPDASRAEASALLETALNDEGPVALAAVEALRGVGGPSSARAARRLLLRDDPELVQAAVACVGAHGDRECVEELIPLMAHPHWAVRSEAIGTLAERHVVQAVPAILRRLETEQDDFVRDAILRALRRLES